MPEEAYRLNPIIAHLMDDFLNDGMLADEALDHTTKLFDKIPKDERHLSDKPWTCPKCKKVFETDKNE